MQTEQSDQQPDFHTKRIEYLRQAREAEAKGDVALGSQYRILATNCDALASGDPAAIARLTVPQPPLTESTYDKNLRRLNEALASRASSTSAPPDSVNQPQGAS